MKKDKKTKKNGHNKMMWQRWTPMRWTLVLLLAFILLYVLVVGICYDDILRMMEGNSWVDNHILHFFRWPLLGALIMCLPMALAGLLLALLLKCLKRPRLIPASMVLPILLAYFFPPKANGQNDSYCLFSEAMKADEQVCTYMRLADEKEWDALLKMIRDDGNIDTPLGMRYALLAENALGHFPDALFTYPVTSPEDLLFRGMREPVMCQFNRLFYENLGVYDEAFHHAMEYGLQQKEGCCMHTLRHLVDYALAEGDVRVAEKYLAIVDRAWFNGAFVKERRKRLQSQKAVMDDRPLREDNFVGLYPLRSEMVRLAYYKVGDTQKTVDYLLCIALLEKNLDTFYKVLTQFPNYQNRSLPRAYQEAFDILQSQGQAWRNAPPGSYAYYFYNVASAGTNDDVNMPSTSH